MNISSQSQKSEPTVSQNIASNAILEALFPGIFTTQPGYGGSKVSVPALAQYEKSLGTPLSSIMADVPGVSTSILTPGQGQAPGTQGTSLLPSIADLSTYLTLGQKADAGMLSPSESALYYATIGQAFNPDLANSMFSGIGGTGGVGGGASAPTIQQAPDIGTLTTQILGNLPKEFQGFVSNVLSSTTPDAINKELDNFSQAMMQQAQQDAQSLGGQLMSTFASQGIGTSGSAMDAMKGVAIQVATNANSQIANARLQMLNTLENAKQIGVSLVNSLLDAGKAEQANIVNQNVAQLDAQTRVITAQIQAQAQSQQALIAAKASLANTQLGLEGDLFRGLLGESSAQEQTRIAGEKLPYDLLLGIISGTHPGQSTASQSGFGVTLPDISGLLSLI